jgi:2-polyprenyl-6-methoxyphenol hydroxylase and related FAD-dependent oxidoreductases
MECRLFQTQTMSLGPPCYLNPSVSHTQKKVSKPQLPDPYVYWVLVTHYSNITSSNGTSWPLSPEKSAELSRYVTKSWHPDLQVLFEMQDETQTSTRWMVSASPELASWDPSPHVTLLGDAIHTMPPTGAMGANTALRDAADLARRLEVAVNSQTLGQHVIGEYESELRNSARTAIALSWQGGMKAFGLKPAVECDKILL